MKRAIIGIFVALLGVLNLHAQNNQCVRESVTNCTLGGGDPFVLSVSEPASGWPYVCVGDTISVTATVIGGAPGLLDVTTTNEDCSVEDTIIVPTNAVIWWEAFDGVSTNSGLGTNAVFAVTNCGTATLIYGMTYCEDPSCGGGTNTVMMTNYFTVASVVALSPTNSTNFVCVASNANSQTFTIPMSTNPSITKLEIVATSCPFLGDNFPECWSLNGEQTNIINVPITNLGIFTVVCTAGTSSLTNVILVTAPDGEVERDCPTNMPDILGYWSFDSSRLANWWRGESNANDSAGMDNGTLHNVTFTNGESGSAFYFSGSNSYVSFGTDAGNFGTNDFTIDFWMKTSSTQELALLAKRPICNWANMWHLRMLAAGNLTFEISQDSIGTPDWNGATLDSITAVNDGAYHELTLTRSNLLLSIYIDGHLDNSVTASAVADIQNDAIMTAGSNVCIGADSTHYFSGAMDEIQIILDDITPWVGNEGQQPAMAYGLQNPGSPWGRSLRVDTNTTANLNYPYITDGGAVNMNCAAGAVSFWFKPDWNGGSGLGNGSGGRGQLLEMGNATGPGWWSLQVDSSASFLTFQTESNGHATTYFSLPISSWSSNDWYQIVLNYSDEQTSLYVNGALAETGPGLTNYPDIPTRLAYGFSIGSDHSGQNQIRGTMDELYAFDCPLTGEQVADGFSGYAGYPGPGVSLSILTQPTNQNVHDGENAVFSVLADGTPTLTYQWTWNGTNIAGATSNTYVLTNAQLTNEGSYVVVVSNAFGALSSSTALLQVVQANFVAVAMLDSNASYSMDGANWFSTALPYALPWSDVAFGGGKFAAIATATNAGAISANGLDWTSMNLPESNLWSAITYGGGKFVAVAMAGSAAAYSCDGVNWTNAALPLSNNWDSVTYGGGEFVAIAGNTNAIAWSTDGISWSPAMLPESNAWKSVTYGNGTFVAIAAGGNAAAAISTDGTNWSNTGLTSGNWQKVVYGTNQFVALTIDSQMVNVTSNGTSWFLDSGGMPAGSLWSDAVYGSGVFVAVGEGSTNAAFSVDGTNWMESFIPQGNWTGIAARFEGQGGLPMPTIVIEPIPQTVFDGTSVTFTGAAVGNPPFSYQWEFNGTPISGATNSNYTVTNVQAGNDGTYSIVISNAYGVAASLGAVLTSVVAAPIVAVANWSTNTAYSLDGINWHASSSPWPSSWDAIAGGNGELVAIADNYVVSTNCMYTTNGTFWQPGSGSLSADEWSSIVYGNGFFLAFADDTISGIGAQPTNMAFSSDGINWIPFDSGLSESPGWSTAAYGNGIFVALPYGGDVGAFSTDGTNWAQSNLPLYAGWTAVAYGNGKFVAVANYGNAVISSADGVNWTNSPTGLPCSNYWDLVAAGGGTFVALASGDSRAAYSTDGVTWYSSSMPDSNIWSGLIYTDGKFVAVASDTSEAAYSENGIDWTATTMPAWDDWTAVGSTYIAVSDSSPSIVVQPVSQTITSGHSTFFIVAAIGTPTPSYQWQFNGTNIAGATCDVYSIANTVASNAGAYTVTVSNTLGWTNSAVAALTVVPTNGQPIFVAIDGSGGTNVACTYDGTNWFLSPEGLPAGNFWGKIIEGDGLFVAIGSNSTNAAYSTNGLSWTASPTGLPAVQSWSGVAYGNGMFLAIGDENTTTNAAYSTNGIDWSPCPSQLPSVDYWNDVAFGNGMFVVLGGSYAAYSTGGSSWTVEPLPAPGRYTGICHGKGAFIAIMYGYDFGATSTNGINWSLFQLPNSVDSPEWQAITYGSNGFLMAGVEGATSSNGIDWAELDWPKGPSPGYVTCAAYGNGIYAALNSTKGLVGYSTNCIDWIWASLPNIWASWVSVAARNPDTNMSAPPSIVNQPVGQAVDAGGTAEFQVYALGTAPLSYQWQFNGTNMAGSTANSLIITNAQVGNSGVYTVTVQNNDGSASSSGAPLAILPSIIRQPTSQNVSVGGTIQFTVNATGTAPLLYQWQTNGVDITGATLSAYLLTNAQVANSGEYTVEVGNSGGTVVSQAASLVVLPLEQPQSSNQIVVLDTNSSPSQLTLLTNFTFQGDTTYYVNGPIMLFGTNTIEGGAVIKYGLTNSSQITVVGTNLILATGLYRPAIFTSRNDNSIGAVLAGSTGNPWGDRAGLMGLYFSNKTASLSNVRFSHLSACVSLQGTNNDSGGTLAMSDFQAVDCGQIVLSKNATCALFNGLVYEASNLFGSLAGTTGTGQNLTSVNLTVHECGSYATDQSGPMYFTNCLFANVTNIFTNANQTSTNSTYFLSNDFGVFQSEGAAEHYLADQSPYQDCGTTNLEPSQLADLAKKTTEPPLEGFSGWVTNDCALYPQAARDTGVPDIGYHYDPIDYLASVCVSNATMTLAPGTVVASSGPQFGIWLYSSGILESGGTATQPNYIVRYNMAQEQANTNCETTNWVASVVTPSISDSNSSASFFFTYWSAAGMDGHFASLGDASMPVGFQDCQFWNGALGGVGETIQSTNCLFERTSLDVASALGSNSLSNLFCNNLFLSGRFTAAHLSGDSGVWTFRDNLFDATTVAVSNTGPSDVYSNNAYVTNYPTMTIDAGDVILTARPDYQTGTLGSYYYPSNLPLIHAGSRLASAVGLYHYTVTTNNAIEGTNVVSIGFHYVATDTNGVPLDTPSDGVPDYLADTNGNGIVDPGEISWTNYTSPNGLSGSGSLVIFTELK